LLRSDGVVCIRYFERACSPLSLPLIELGRCKKNRGAPVPLGVNGIRRGHIRACYAIPIQQPTHTFSHHTTQYTYLLFFTQCNSLPSSSLPSAWPSLPVLLLLLSREPPTLHLPPGSTRVVTLDHAEPSTRTVTMLSPCLLGYTRLPAAETTFPSPKERRLSRPRLQTLALDALDTTSTCQSVLSVPWPASLPVKSKSPGTRSKLDGISLSLSLASHCESRKRLSAPSP
jgi:hypothetical protein